MNENFGCWNVAVERPLGIEGADGGLRDSEQVPLGAEGGIDIHRRMLGIIPPAVKIGYEIGFTRYFYKPQPMRTLEETRADILALKREAGAFLTQIIR